MSSEGAAVRVWGNGCYDVFHFGHANFIRQAKMMGDHMIAGVHGDKDITQNKGKPVMDQVERARMISAVKWVDDVEENIPYGNILATLDVYNCNFCVHGDDIARDAEGNDIYEECKNLGRFRECKRTEGISTTDLIDRILLSKNITFLDGNAARKGADAKTEPMPEEYYMKMMSKFSVPSREPRDNDVILYTQGVFDLFHSGHVDFLEQCRRSEEKSYVIAGVLSDEEANRVYGTYPITNVYERALALLSCRFVDKVVMNVPFDVTPELLEQHKVNYVCHGKAWDLPRDPYAAARERDIFRTVDSGSELTTEMIIERIISHSTMYYIRNTKKSESCFSGQAPETALKEAAQ